MRIRPEPVRPKPDTLVANVNATIEMQSSTLRSESGSRTYMSTPSWMISGEVLK